MSRYIAGYVYTCDDCGATAASDDGLPPGWTCPDPTYDTSPDYCPACSAKREPQPAPPSTGDECPTCRQIVGYGSALETLVHEYLDALANDDPPADYDAVVYEARERLERATGWEPSTL